MNNLVIIIKSHLMSEDDSKLYQKVVHHCNIQTKNYLFN